MQLSTRVPFLLVAVVALGQPACTGGPRTYPVKGKIMYDGKPVPTGTVLFTPVKGGPSATGEINSSGVYSLTTYKPRDGALIGEYWVAISAMESREGKELNAPLPQLIPDKYSSVALSGLKVEVKEGDNVCDFTLVGSVRKITSAAEVVPRGKKMLAEQAQKEKAKKAEP